MLGMNVDRDDNDARHMVQAMKTNYPVLKARERLEKCLVTAVPSLTYFPLTFFTTSWAALTTIDSISSANGAGQVLP